MNPSTQKLVETVYERLDALNNISVTRKYRDELHDLCRIEEVQHRKGTGGSKGYTLIVDTTAKFFVVRDLAYFATNARQMPSMREALGLRGSYLLAAMLYANFAKEIDRALGADAHALAALDYVQECCK